MGVQKDASELLIFFYDELIKKGKDSVKAQDVFDVTRWDGKRINFAYNYLNQLGLLKGVGGARDSKGLDGFVVLWLLPKGIDIVENEPKFEETFGYEVNLGVFKFSWSTTEK